MSTSPLDPQEVRAAAEVYRELGPEYSDAVVAAFIDRVDQAVAARVEARLAQQRQRQPVVRHRRTVLKGVALGVCAGALVAGVSISHAHVGIQQARMAVPYHVAKPGPGHEIGPIKPPGPPKP
jgi:ferric-dicitrate binding protein FerR (iron transport regulator)